MTGHGTKLKRMLEDAVAAMLTQRNTEEAARSVDVSTASLMRWQKLPEFQELFREGRRAAYTQAAARLQQGTSAAATTLLKMMVDPSTPPSVRVRAAEAMFHHAAKGIEVDDIELREGTGEGCEHVQTRRVEIGHPCVSALV
jgi:hypothetical protein